MAMPGHKSLALGHGSFFSCDSFSCSLHSAVAVVDSCLAPEIDKSALTNFLVALHPGY